MLFIESSDRFMSDARSIGRPLLHLLAVYRANKLVARPLKDVVDGVAAGTDVFVRLVRGHDVF